MVWPGINGGEVLCHIRVPKGVKTTPAAPFQLLDSDLFAWLVDALLLKRCRYSFQHA